MEKLSIKIAFLQFWAIMYITFYIRNRCTHGTSHHVSMLKNLLDSLIIVTDNFHIQQRVFFMRLLENDGLFARFRSLYSTIN